MPLSNPPPRFSGRGQDTRWNGLGPQFRFSRAEVRDAACSRLLDFSCTRAHSTAAPHLSYYRADMGQVTGTQVKPAGRHGYLDSIIPRWVLISSKTWPIALITVTSGWALQ
jgi:hypothetical protein